MDIKPQGFTSIQDTYYAALRRTDNFRFDGRHCIGDLLTHNHDIDNIVQ